MKILVTGSAGFIGFHLTKKLISEGHQIIGLDNFNNYYDVNLKIARNNFLLNYSKGINKIFKIVKKDISDYKGLEEVFKKNNFDKVIHLAAQAGVRYSIKNPSAYIESNIVGFSNILELCAKNNVKHLIYASSSSVYGGNKKFPFSENDNVDHPVSLYAATKNLMN